jgi:hypothetical protein
MPNDRHWSASMLLSWVLTPDIEAVHSMADEYGGWQIDGETAARIQPPSWDDVLRVYAIDDSLPKDERAREAARRAILFVIPARQKVFDALRSGAIEGWARPNGSGDIVKIEPIQWAGLRFRCFHGHDIAVPVDGEGEPLRLPRPLTDYLSGAVPRTFTPTVWPDPLFPGDQVMRLWPAIPRPNERLTLPEQVRLLAQIMPEERARARIEKAFRLREIDYHPQYVVPYDGAWVDWDSGQVILPKVPRQPFTPTLTAADFFGHFMPRGYGAAESPGAAPQSLEKSMAEAGEPQEAAAERTVAPQLSGIRMTSDEKVETACGEWIAGLTERPRNKDTAFADAKAAVAHIGALSFKAFERIWANRAPGDWKKPGRPKKQLSA